MSTTPTPADHDAAKRVADRCRLDAAPWQLEHLASAIAEVRAAGRAAGYDEGDRAATETHDRALGYSSTSAVAAPPKGVHAPCCTAHGVTMTCERYRRTHFVEVRPCCAIDAALLADGRRSARGEA